MHETEAHTYDILQLTNGTMSPLSQYVLTVGSCRRRLRTARPPGSMDTAVVVVVVTGRLCPRQRRPHLLKQYLVYDY